MAITINEIKLDMESVKDFISKSSKETGIYIGCDSKVTTRRGKKVAIYVAVIVIHYDSNNGAKLFKMVKVEPDYGNMRQRLMREVYIAGEIAYEIADVVDERPFEIHLDINSNPDFKSNVIAKEAAGYIMGMMGIKAKLKPYALAASFAADRYAVQIADKGHMQH